MIKVNYEVYYRKLEESSAFMSYDLLKKYNRGFEKDKYESETYKNKLVRFKNLSENNILDEIYEILNIRHPMGYDKRSLSVGDIVVINNKAFFVDRFGFVDVTKYFIM